MNASGGVPDRVVWARHFRRDQHGDLVMHLGTQVSSRRTALRAGDLAGMLYGMMARTTGKMSRTRARQLAAMAAAGRSGGPHPVPNRWRTLFDRAFIRAAVFAAHTNRNIRSNSKYGVE